MESKIKYGLISETDARCLEKTIDLICEQFPETNPVSEICVTEIGLFDCGTAFGLNSYLYSKKRLSKYIGIDNEKDKPINKPYWMEYIKGNSNEVYNQLEDNSQHLIFVDGCHCFAHVISDFFCYAQKVKVGGYLAFHDTGKHIKPFKDFQHGDKNNPDAYISVRKALEKIGMFQDAGYDIINNSEGTFLSPRYLGGHGFRLIYDEADCHNEAGGVCVFVRKK